MDRKPQDRNDEGPSLPPKAWRARVAADLLAYRAEQQRLWGGIDDMTRARYVAGVSPEDERKRVEQAMLDHPALCKAINIGRELSAEQQPDTSAGGTQQSRRAEEPWADRSDRPETNPGKAR